MRNKAIEQFNEIISDLNRFTDYIEQLEKDNNKLNEDLQALEKERDEGYKSFNTDTHILIERDVLQSIRDDLQEAKGSASYALDEARGAVSCAEDAAGSAELSEDHCRYAMDKIDETIEQAHSNKNNGDNND